MKNVRSVGLTVLCVLFVALALVSWHIRVQELGSGYFSQFPELWVLLYVLVAVLCGFGAWLAKNK